MKIAKQQEKLDSSREGYDEEIEKLTSSRVLLIKKSGPGIMEKHKEIDEKIKTCKDSKKELDLYYVAIKNNITAEDLYKEGFEDWKRVGKLKNFGKKDRDHYEAFVLGYLTYFESHVIKEAEKKKRNFEEYTLYFDWGKTRPGEFDLVIYLKPLQKRIYPPIVKQKSLAGASNGKLAIQMSPFPPPPSMTDPVQPPGPPPPPRPTKRVNFF